MFDKVDTKVQEYFGSGCFVLISEEQDGIFGGNRLAEVSDNQDGFIYEFPNLTGSIGRIGSLDYDEALYLYRLLDYIFKKEEYKCK